ncbi:MULTISPECIES: hypothetical protein, partial [Pseudomonas syringae group genomosp. 2]|uniref:hypothetical protein n=1 Tax=Pseudomonas syringae group genomosp. 2 TaxID=251698 RepID=UPI001C7FC178
MGLTVGRGRINKNELAEKYLERFVVAWSDSSGLGTSPLVLLAEGRGSVARSASTKAPLLVFISTGVYAEHRTVVKTLWERTCS